MFSIGSQYLNPKNGVCMSELNWSVADIDEFVDGLKYDDKGLITAVMHPIIF